MRQQCFIALILLFKIIRNQCKNGHLCMFYCITFQEDHFFSMKTTFSNNLQLLYVYCIHSAIASIPNGLKIFCNTSNNLHFFTSCLKMRLLSSATKTWHDPTQFISKAWHGAHYTLCLCPLHFSINATNIDLWAACSLTPWYSV